MRKIEKRREGKQLRLSVLRRNRPSTGRHHVSHESKQCFAEKLGEVYVSDVLQYTAFGRGRFESLWNYARPQKALDLPNCCVLPSASIDIRSLRTIVFSIGVNR